MRNIIKLDHPAADWERALPLGNGRLGAMISGQVDEETVLLNEETMFYGGPKDRYNPDTKENLGRIRSLLKQGKAEEANFLARAAMTGTPRYLSPFQPAAILRLFHFRPRGELSAYRRVLDIDNAAAEVSYVSGGFQFRREYFTSLTSNVLAVRISGEAPFSLIANLNRRPFEEHTGKIDGNTVGIWGQCGTGGISYFGAARMLAQGGEFEALGDALTLRGAKSAVIFVSFETDYKGNITYREKVLDSLDTALQAGFEALRTQHTAKYHELYNRVELSINDTKTPEENTDTLLEKMRDGGASDYLTLLEFNMGRYLLISSSYNCRLPANLQGLWNGSYTPPWESVYTVNINLEMNYWPAEVCGLSECTKALFDLVDLAAEKGKDAARKLYGAGGFVFHHNIDFWGDPNPTGLGDAPPFWVMGGPWLALHYFEHYQYTQDRDFLKNRALPVMEGALKFFLDYLTEDEKGLLHTGPAASPENSFITADGQRAALCMSPASDIQILRELGKCYLRTCEILGLNHETRGKIEDMISRLPETRLTKDGRIREWLEDYGEIEPGHRHFSHLFALHPGTQFTEENRELFEAAKKTLEYRLSHGSGHTGWSCAWVILFQARLKDAEQAHRFVKQLIGGKTSENMLNIHPPFVIDGNFGFTAAIAEMLVQSHGDCYELLPALPSAWKTGFVKGLNLRGGAVLDMSWNGGKLSEALIMPRFDAVRVIKYGNTALRAELKAGVPYSIKG